MRKPTVKQLWWGIKQNEETLSRQCLKYALYDCLCAAEPMFVPADFCHNQQWLNAAKTMASLKGTVADYKQIAQTDADRLAAGYVLSDKQVALVPELIGELVAEQAEIIASRFDEFYRIPNKSNFYVRLLIAELSNLPETKLADAYSHIGRVAALNLAEEDICLLWGNAGKSVHLLKLAQQKTFNGQKLYDTAGLCKVLALMYNDSRDASLYFEVMEYAGIYYSKPVKVLEALCRFMLKYPQYARRAEKLMLKILKTHNGGWEAARCNEFKSFIFRISGFRLLCLKMVNALHPDNLDTSYLKLAYDWCEHPCDDSLDLLNESAGLLQRGFKNYPFWAEEIYFAAMDLLKSFSAHMGAKALIDKETQDWHFERCPFPPAVIKVLEVYFVAAASEDFKQASVDNYERLLSFVHYAKLKRSAKLEKQFAHLRKAIPMDSCFFVSPMVALYHNPDVSEFVREMIVKLLEEKIIFSVSLNDLRRIALQDFALRLQIDDTPFWEKRRQKEQREQQKKAAYAKKAAALLKKLEHN